MHKRFKLIAGVVAVTAVFIAAYLIARPASTPATNKITSGKSQGTPSASKVSETPGPKLDTELQNQLQAWDQNHAGNYGIAVQELNGTQRHASYEADEQFVAASTYKLFVTYAVLHDIEQGKSSLSTPTSLGMTVQQCIDAMLIRSNNDCGYPVGKLVGWNNLNSLIEQHDFTQTNIDNYDASGNTTSADKLSSAKDQATFMGQLVGGKLLNKNHTELMLSRMKQQIYRERIPAGVPSDVEVADKPGWLPGIQNDTAVVYGPRSTYVISIMSTGTAPGQLAELSKMVYEYLNT